MDATRQAAKWKRLQPDLSRSGEAGKEEAFSTEDGRLHASNELNVVADRRLECDDATRVDPQVLAAGKLSFDHGSAGMHEGQTVSFQLWSRPTSLAILELT